MNRIPKGCVSYGAELGDALERCRASFMERFGAYGYVPFFPSGLQLLESSWEMLPPSFRKRLLLVTSPFGEPCCLRPDITLAVVSSLASGMKSAGRPRRICYADRVYKKPEGRDAPVETYQLGAERLGWDGEGADMEMIVLLIGALESMGLVDITIALGDVSIMRTAMNRTGSASTELVDVLQSGSLTEFLTLVDRADIPDYSRRILRELPFLKGNGDVLDAGTKLFDDPDIFRNLRNLYDGLVSLGYGDRIALDLGLARELGYYSGPVFDVYAPDSGVPIGGGGRYDALLQRFGVRSQAVGCAINLERSVIDAVSREKDDTLVAWGGGGRRERAFLAAERLRASGIRFEMSWCDDVAASMRDAREGGQRWWTDLSGEEVIDLERGGSVGLASWSKGRRTC